MSSDRPPGSAEPQVRPLAGLLYRSANMAKSLFLETIILNLFVRNQPSLIPLVLAGGRIAGCGMRGK